MMSPNQEGKLGNDLKIPSDATLYPPEIEFHFFFFCKKR